MALPKALVRIPIAGISSKESELLIEPGSLATLDNCTLDAAGPGGATAAKRLGFTQLTGTLIPSGSVTSADGLATFGDELIRFDGSTAYAYVDGGNAAISKGPVSPCIVTSRSMVADAREQQFSDMAIANDYALVAWYDSAGGVRAQIFDAATWRPLASEEVLDATATRVRVIAIGNYLHAIWRDGAGLSGHYFDTTSADPTDSTSYVITAGGVGGQGHFDAITQTTTRAAYCYTAAAGTVNVGYINQLGVVSVAPAEVAVVDGATINFPTLYTDSTDTYVTCAYWRDATGVRAFSRLASDLTAVAAPGNINAGGTAYTIAMTRVSGTSIRVYWSSAVSATVGGIRTATYNPATGGAGTTDSIFHRARIVSRAFVQDSDDYVLVEHLRLTGTTTIVDSLQSTYYLLRLRYTDIDGVAWYTAIPSIVGKALTYRAGELDTAGPMTFTFSNPSTGVWICAGSIKTRLDSTGNNVFSRTGIARLTFDFGSARLYQSAQIGGNLHVVGGVLSAYDGQSFVESNYHYFSEEHTLTEINPGAGNLPNGTYSYRLVPEWTDIAGNVVRGLPSVALSITVAAGPSNVQLAIPNSSHSYRTPADVLGNASGIPQRSNFAWVVYRTVAGGTAYYKTLTTTDPAYNDPTTFGTSAYTDNLVDATLIGRQILYTTGGVLENTSVPACSVIAAGKNRLFLAGIDDDPNIIWYSKEYVKGEALAFSDSLTMRVDPTSIAAPDGEITGLAVMDSSLLVFLENCVIAVAGDGPTDSGEQNTFGAPQLVTSDTGCSDARSICITPAGVLFKGAKGIYLLTRGMQVQYIGAPVEAYNSLTLTSAVLIEGKNQVRITHSDGVALCYDYYTGQWSTFSNHAALDAVMWSGSYTYLRTSGGTVYREAASTWTDPSSTSITMTVVTPWIKTAGIAGFQRLRRLIVLGTYYAAHTLRVRIAYDYSSSYSDTYDYVTSSDADVATRYECRVHVEQQKCEAFRVELTDVSPSGTQRSATWSAIVAECGVKQGPAKMPAAKSI